jgi:hypothetical protein
MELKRIAIDTSGLASALVTFMQMGGAWRNLI